MPLTILIGMTGEIISADRVAVGGGRVKLYCSTYGLVLSKKSVTFALYYSP